MPAYVCAYVPVCVPVPERAYACARASAWVRVCVGVRACACTRACVGRRVCARMYICGGVYVCEAILSRFKRLSRFRWYTDTKRIRYALRCFVRCLSASPMVGRGVVGLAWGCVWAGIVPPLCTRVGGRRAVGAPLGAYAHRRTHGRACVRTYTRVPTGGCVHICANLCALALAGVPPCALGCVRGRACVRPYIYIIPTLIISQQFFWTPVIRSAAGCMPISYVLLMDGACEKFEQIEGPCVTESVGECHIGSVNRIEFLLDADAEESYCCARVLLYDGMKVQEKKEKVNRVKYLLCYA